jgi:hypothetical protein
MRDDLELHGRVQELLWAYPGGDELRIHCRRSDGSERQLLSRRRVDAEPSLIRALGDVVGAEAVRVEIATRAPADDFAVYSAD